MYGVKIYVTNTIKYLNNIIQYYISFITYNLKMKNMISVIIPVYNVEDYLHVCLISILKQTYPDFEIICIDDASTDSSPEILEYFARTDSRITLFKNDINKGEDFCKNMGIEIAQGDFIYFLDANGWLNLDTFEILMENMEKNNSDFILFKSRLFNNDSKSFEEDFHNVNFLDNLDSNVFNPQNLEKYMQFLISHAPLNKFYSKSFITENRLNFDSNFPNNLFNLAKKISFLNIAFYNVFKKIGSNDKFTGGYSTLFNKFIKEFLLFIPLDDKGFIKMIDIDSLVIFKLLNNIEDIFIEKKLFNYFKNVFFKFKLSNLINYFNIVSSSEKKEFYNKMKQEFVEMRLNFKDLINLPFDLYKFYIIVLNYDYEKFIRFNRFSKINHIYIIKQDLIEKIENFNEMGINTKKRDESIIVSLTSFPERLFDIHFCLYSLLNQTLKPDKLILCLVRDDFPNGEEDIPQNVLNLKNNGLTIKWCDNLRSFTKLIPVLEEYPKEYIITVDDDIFYPEDLIETMWNTYKKYPNTIISSRTRIIEMNGEGRFREYKDWPLINEFADSSFLNFSTSSGGTLYFPNALSSIAFEKDIFKKLCPTNDDIWFWAMAVLNKTKITSNLKPHDRLKYVNISREIGIDNNRTLWNLNKFGQNDIQFKKVLEYFPEILKIIYES